MTAAPVTAETARAKLLSAMQALPAPAMPHAAMVDRVSQALLSGEDVPTDLIDEVAADMIRQMAVEEVRSVLRDVLERVNAAIREAEATKTPARLAALDALVRRVQQGARDLLPALGGVRSSTEAMRSNDDAKIGAWRVLLGLAEEYQRIRQEQLLLSTGTGGSRVVISAETVAKLGLMENVDEVWPDRVGHTLGRAVPDAPWPHPKGQPWRIANDVDFLLWAAQSGAVLWVPTVAQINDAFAAAVKAADQARMEAGEKVARERQRFAR